MQQLDQVALRVGSTREVSSGTSPNTSQKVRDVLQPALAQFQDPATGTVTLTNTFRWVAVER